MGKLDSMRMDLTHASSIIRDEVKRAAASYQYAITNGFNLATISRRATLLQTCRILARLDPTIPEDASPDEQEAYIINTTDELVMEAMEWAANHEVEYTPPF